MSPINKALTHPKVNVGKRRNFQQQIVGHHGRQIIDLDESSFADDLPRTHGYPERGKRCDGILDWRTRGRVNVISALLGTTPLTISMFAGNINSDPFHAWMTQELIPKLPPHRVMVVDNATFHKRKDTQSLSSTLIILWNISHHTHLT